MAAGLPVEEDAAGGCQSSSEDRETDEGEAIKDTLEPNALLHAAFDGDLDGVKRLIEQGHSVHETDRVTGDTVLNRAAWGGYVDIIAELLRNGAEIDARNKEGETALFYAAGYGRLGAVQQLINHGAVVDAATENGMTPLLRAADSGGLDVVRELIKNDADMHATTKDGRSVIHCAAAGRDSDVVAELLSRGVDPAARTKDGRSALHCAAAGWRDSAAIAGLLSRRVNLVAKTKDGKSALSIAVEKGNSNVLEVLLLATALDKDTSSAKRIELFKAAALSNLDSVEKLVKEGEPVDTMTTDGRTPLFYAAEFGCKKVVQTLTDLGASVSKQSISSDLSLGGETP
ncbi:hypothetical protein Gpo141_00013450, partial [Globisporangium polare]